MPLIIDKAQEADIPKLLDIMYTAFADDPWDRIMFPQIPPPDRRGLTIARWRDEVSVDPHTAFMKVVDTDLNESIAFARWHIYRTERPESEWKGAEARGWDEGTNVEAANEFGYKIHEKREKVMGGKPHCCLNMLATHPYHQRRGAGRMLLRWGTDVADEAKTLPCYLEATPVGQHLYQSAGFEHVETLDMDLSKWGGEGIYHHYVMVRPAKGI